MMFTRMFTDTSNVQTCLTASVYMTISLTLERYFSVVQPLYQLQNRLLHTINIYHNKYMFSWNLLEGWRMKVDVVCKFTLVQMNWNFEHVLQSETHRTNQNLAFQINFEPPKKFNISNITYGVQMSHWHWNIEITKVQAAIRFYTSVFSVGFLGSTIKMFYGTGSREVIFMWMIMIDGDIIQTISSILSPLSRKVKYFNSR